MINTSIEQSRLVRFPELQSLLGGVSRAKIERDVAAGILPPPLKIGRRAVAWKWSEIQAYLDSLQRVPADSYKARIKMVRTR